MKKIIIILGIIACIANGCGQTNNKNNNNMIDDYGTCYLIGDYQLCPENKIIRVWRMDGTATKDWVGYVPEPSVKYDEETMIIFAGWVFFDKSGLNIDWQMVELLSYSDSYSEFTDGKFLYYIKYGSEIYKTSEYDKTTYKPYVEEKSVKQKKEFPGNFYVKGNKFYYDDYPILEEFDVPNLRTIVSKNGFETDYITDDNQVLYGGERMGMLIAEENEKEYVVEEEWIIEGVDFASLRVLGKDMLADKNALYYRNNVIPFDKLNGFKFIIREM
jgi:hypothetical protein